MTRPVLRTEVCDILGIEYPILQGAFGTGGGPKLYAAISNAGGLGMIGSGRRAPDLIVQEIRETKELTDKPFGLNIVIRRPHEPEYGIYRKFIQMVIDEGVKVVSTGAGDPTEVVSIMKEHGVKVLPVTSGVGHAIRVEKAGADMVVSTGLEGGGHVGDLATLPLIPQVADAVKIPVIAGGGIADGRGMAAALALGAKGVQMGTRFGCTEECCAHINYKQAIVDADDRCTVIMGRAFRDPSRGMLNPYSKRLLEMEAAGASREEYIKYNANRSIMGFYEGNVTDGRILFGQVAGLIHDIPTCEEVVQHIVKEALEVMNAMGQTAAKGSSA